MTEHDPSVSKRSHAEPGPAELSFQDLGVHGFTADAHRTAEEFAADHALEITTLREDVEGAFRQGGPLRILSFVILVPSVFPLFGQTHYRLAGGGFEVHGMIASYVCALLMAAVLAVSRGRPFDKHTLGIYRWVAFACAAGAGLAWWNAGAQLLTWPFTIAAMLVAASWLVLEMQRLRHPDVAKLREEDAMDRAEFLRRSLHEELRKSVRPPAATLIEQASERFAELAGAGGSTGVAEALFSEVVERTVPMPTQRTFAEDNAAKRRN